MLIRFYDQSDADAVASIHIASWQQTYRGMLPDHALDTYYRTNSGILHEKVPQDSDIHLVAVEDGEIVGLCRSSGKTNHMWIDTCTSCSGQGIGQKLI